MSSHAFAVGETVRFFPSALQSPGFGGPYVVVRQLPVDSEGPQYRVKCLDNGQERVVPEMQLEPFSPARAAGHRLRAAR